MAKGKQCLTTNLKSKKGVFKVPKGKSTYQLINKNKCYPVRGGNNLPKLRNWIKWAGKNYPEQNMILIDNLENMKDKLSKIRRKANLDNRYEVYGSY